MKKLLLLTICILCFAVSAQGATYTLTASNNQKITDSSVPSGWSALQDGDVIQLSHTDQPTYIWLEGITKNITINNDGSTVTITYDAVATSTGAIYIDNCTGHITIDGESEYGIIVDTNNKSNANGIRVVNNSPNITIQYLWIKNAPKHALQMQGSSSAITNLDFDHNKVTAITEEGLYIGNGSNYNHSNLSVTYNIFDTIGWECMQAIDFDGGTNVIAYNNMQNCGAEGSGTGFTGDGIVIGHSDSLNNTVANIHHNFIKNTFRHGIYIDGTNGTEIYNNIIADSGSYGGGSSGYNIRCGGSNLVIYNNTLVDGEDGEIYFGSATGDIDNNLIAHTTTASTEGYGSMTDGGHNWWGTVANAAFNNAGGDDYSLTESTAAAILAGGTDLGSPYDTGFGNTTVWSTLSLSFLDRDQYEWDIGGYVYGEVQTAGFLTPSNINGVGANLIISNINGVGANLSITVNP